MSSTTTGGLTKLDRGRGRGRGRGCCVAVQQGGTNIKAREEAAGLPSFGVGSCNSLRHCNCFFVCRCQLRRVATSRVDPSRFRWLPVKFLIRFFDFLFFYNFAKVFFLFFVFFLGFDKHCPEVYFVF